MRACATPHIGGPAKDTGTRTFRSPLFSFIRAIAGRSWRSIISCAPPTTSPIIATLPPDEKLALLDRLEAGLIGGNDDDAVAVRLRAALAERSLPPRHAQDLLAAFKLDATKLRYRDWDDLMHYCSYSAMPVGRFVLDVHGENRSMWPANDALCAALQVINHLQDCKEDYLNLDRVYLPLDVLAAGGTSVEALGEQRASPALIGCLHRLAERTERLLGESDMFAAMIDDWRLSLEVSVINRLAHRLVRMLKARDPLSDRVELHAPAIAGLTTSPLSAGCRDGSAVAHPPRRKRRGVRE